MLRLVFFAGLASCTHHRTVDTVPPYLMGETLTVKGRDGVPYRAHAEVTPSGIVWRDEAGRDVMRLADTYEVVELNRAVGALEGPLFGVPIGIALGALGGLALGDDDCEGNNGFCPSAGYKAFLLGATGALAGTVVGVIAGASRGSRYVWRFRN